MVSVIQEVLSSMRVVKAFAREDYEAASPGGGEPRKRRDRTACAGHEGAALAAGGSDCRGRHGAGALVWSAMVLAGNLSPGSLVLFIWYLGKMYKPMQELSKMTDS